MEILAVSMFGAADSSLQRKDPVGPALLGMGTWEVAVLLLSLSPSLRRG